MATARAMAATTASPNVTVTLRDALNAVVGTTTTDANGNYSFFGLPAGNYTVVETQPAGYGSSSRTPCP